MPEVPAPPDLAARQADIVEAVLAGQPLRTTVDAVCRLIEASLPGTRASIRLREGRGLVSAAGPSLSKRYQALLDPHEGALDEAALLRLWTPGACSWQEDLTADEHWAPLRSELQREGLGACYTCPVTGGDGGTSALITLYWPGRHWPTPAERRVVHLASVLTAQAVQHERTEQALSTAANHDPLTGLPNRTLFLDRLRQALARARRHHSGVAVLFLDLDRFKVVNDSLGHAAGDRLLLAATARLTAGVRPEDTVARFGGDEFTVLCEEVDDADVARALGQRLADELARPFVVAQRRFFVTASMGIALGGVGSRPQELIRDADVAMYRSKERGRNRIEVFDSRLRTRTIQRLDDEAALRRDLDNDALVLHYQAVFDLQTLQATGVEALLRWRRADGEELDPRELVGIAEESGLIHRLGTQVLQKACGQLRSLLDAGLVDDSFTVAINVAASQLSDVGLADLVAAHLADHRLQPHQLALEVTESSLADDGGGVPETLQRLRELGVCLWIDDFGTGYSSLARLPSLPVGGLKVDVSIVAGLRTDGGPLLQVVANLAEALGLPLIAEGVEDMEQLELLRQLGVRSGQGWFLARPGSAEELLAVLASSPASA